MTKVDIEKAAAEYASEACRPLWRTGNEQVCMADFTEGAIWRINKIWHDVSEKPKKGEMIIVLRGKYSPIICGPFNFYWDETVEQFGLKKWAYIEDLLPNTED